MPVMTPTPRSAEKTDLPIREAYLTPSFAEPYNFRGKMTDSDPVKFDLATGQVRTGDGERLIVVPLSALDELAQTAGVPAANRFARGIGVAIGRRLAGRMGSLDEVRAATLEAFVSGLALEVALAGWGSLSMERWGKAMVVVVDHAPVKEQAIVAALVEGAIEAAAGREAHGVALAGDGPARVLIASEKSAARARVWTAEGASGSDVIARLQSPGGDAHTGERSGA
jgi:hypothetical protein